MASEGWGKKPDTEIEWAADPVELDPKQSAKEIEKVTQKVAGLHTNNLTTTTQEVTVKLADSSELYTSITSFEELLLPPDLLKGVYALGYQKPSKIQASALPLLLTTPAKNMIGQSQAGTGKTATFSLNILSRVGGQGVQALVLAPARELARQIMDNIRDLGKYTTVTTQLCVPGSVGRGEKVDSNVVVGTPGTIMDLIKKRQLDCQFIKV
jgi:ATP-dependent RNA helicase DDX19/DBP5